MYKVRDGEIIATTIATKQVAVHASASGGTQQHAIDADQQRQPSLTSARSSGSCNWAGRSKRTSAGRRISSGAGGR
jgi:hypothetical protein